MKGVVIKELSSFTDARGYLTELFRADELIPEQWPAMGYLSVTHPGVSRGPHEHVDQTDLFIFLNGKYELRLWENRPDEPYEEFIASGIGEKNPRMVIVPPGVVHGYKNIGDTDAYVLNFPNRLYAGVKKAEPVDEIRHEEMDSKFKMD